MKRILLDTGPIVALFDRTEPHHEMAVDFVKHFHGQFCTTWPVLTEASHLLDFHINVQLDLYRWIDRGGISLEPVEPSDLKRIIDLTLKYSDQPMDLADASLIVLAERYQLTEIATFDKDFLIYRFSGKKMLKNVICDA